MNCLRTHNLDDDDSFSNISRISCGLQNSLNSVYNSDSECSGPVSVRYMIQQYNNQVKRNGETNNINHKNTYKINTPKKYHHPSQHLLAATKSSYCGLNNFGSNTNCCNRLQDCNHSHTANTCCCKNCTACSCCRNGSLNNSKTTKLLSSTASSSSLQMLQPNENNQKPNNHFSRQNSRSDCCIRSLNSNCNKINAKDTITHTCILAVENCSNIKNEIGIRAGADISVDTAKSTCNDSNLLNDYGTELSLDCSNGLFKNNNSQVVAEEKRLLSSDSAEEANLCQQQQPSAETTYQSKTTIAKTSSVHVNHIAVGHHLNAMVNIRFVATVLLWLLLCYHNLCINAQSQNAIGAYRTFQKTSFSCSGRPSGYYADVETGCQVYHMCDGLGRQFSYSCPNTTLFQQRMLICDHWYMVNCSKAESDYTANLLIGQRDKPFVNDEENSLRTPRPDLLDRPYAPDYSGESFRNQYQKSLSSVLNQIYDNTVQKTKDKTLQLNQNQPATGQQRWKIPPPSRIILPPAYEPQIMDESSAKPSTRVSYYTPETTTTTRKPSTLKPTSNTRFQTSKFNNVAALHNRHDDHLQFEHDDLGTSHSTRYNTSADFNSAEDRFAKTPVKSTTQRNPTFNNNFNTAFTTPKSATSTRKTTLIPKIRVPSKIYEPPLLYPIYNIEDATSTTSTTPRPTYRPSTASPFVTRAPAITSPTTTKAPSRPTTEVGKPFTRASAFATSTNVGINQNAINRFDVTKLSKELRTPAPAQGFKPPAATAPTKIGDSAQNVPPNRTTFKHEQPSKQLLPPLTDFITHDVATTQGPPIYYEWKVPSDGLEPPKLESPIGVDGREYPETVIDYNSISTNNGLISVSQFGIDQSKTTKNSSQTKTNGSAVFPTRIPTSRSIKETGQPSSMSDTTSKSLPMTRTSTAQQSSNSRNVFQIGKDLSVPEYAFPLENNGRTGYLDTDAYNSFLLKYPERRADTDEPLHWYGENPKCPECHPSYVIPGTCEPCIRR